MFVSYRCDICRKEIHDEKKDHDSAPHVAYAYHFTSVEPDLIDKCKSCGEEFPCSTRRKYLDKQFWIPRI